MAGPSRPAIIGVVGKTNSDDSELLELALEVGREIAEADQIILTGGDFQHPEESVKYWALRGAASAVEAGSLARVIGILPGSSDSGRKIESGIEHEGLLRYLLVHTGLTSSERNEITGGASDVLIAMKGTGGTAQEVSWALKLGRPVVFLGSLTELTKYLPAAATADAVTAGTSEEAVARALDAIAWRDPDTRRLNGHFPDHFAALKIGYEDALKNLSG